MRAAPYELVRAPQTSNVRLISSFLQVLHCIETTHDSPVYNLNIENTYGKRNGDVQAIALSAYGTRFGAYGCQVRGYQDTLLANYVRPLGPLCQFTFPIATHIHVSPFYSGFLSTLDL